MAHRRIKRISNFAANNIRASFNVDWDVDRYRDEHECDEHWQLRKAFIEKWKNDYPEERLICLAKVFANVEFMGCRYPPAVMQEIAQMSFEIGQQYREQKKNKLQRTFVSASDAAGDRAKGVKRIGGEVVEDGPKLGKIAFVPQGQVIDYEEKAEENCIQESKEEEKEVANKIEEDTEDKKNYREEYLSDMMKINCLDCRLFRDTMFNTSFGRMVLLIRPWAGKMWNIQTSCQVCGIHLTNGYENRCYSLCLNGKLLAEATGDTKVEAKNIVEEIAWERLRRETVSVVIKEQFIAQGDTRISVNDVTGKSNGDVFGTPVENTVAMKMMKLMGWKGGGLGIASQGIEEPIKPNLQMVNRSGLGSVKDLRMLRRAAQDLMQRFIASTAFDLDLVFSSDFTKEERATLHQCAQKIGLSSRSYGEGSDRFLVVKKKLDPFSLVRAVVEKGGSTTKYQVFIPASLGN